MGNNAWRFPFFVTGGITLIVALLLFKYMKPENSPGVKSIACPLESRQFGKGLLYMSMYAVFL